jgi:DNA-binding beta-propeller fold protein YncE
MPEALVASNDNRSFYLINRSSGIISKWDGLNPENRQFLFVLKNPYAMALSPDETRLYVTSRTENSLMVYSITDKKYESVVNVGEKPVDVDISSDGRYVYTLDAGEDKISIINTETFEIENTIDLRTGGFPSTLTIIPGTHNALVTNAESDKLSLVDLESRQVLTDLPIGITSKSLTIGPGPKLQQEQVKEPSQ